MQLGKFPKEIFLPSSVSIGLDIGNFSVKLVQIKKRLFGKDRALSFYVAPIQGSTANDKVIEAIKQASDKVGIESKKVNLSICGSNIIMRYIILPSMKESDLARSLDFELEKYIPYKRENVIIDYHVLAQLPNNQMIVLLIAVERRIIEERINLVKQAGLDPQLINVDGLALMEAFKSALPGSKGVVALLDIGYRLSKLVVMENDIPYFSRDIETGEQEIIQTISEKLGMDFNLSKELLYKRKDMEKDVTEAIKPVLNGLLEELSLSFEYCERNLNKKADRLYLSGGGSKVKILFESIGKIPNFKVDIWDPTKGFNVPSFSTNEELIEYAPILAVAVGLALG